MNLKVATLKGATPFLLSWISLISSISYMAFYSFRNKCGGTVGWVAPMFFLSIGILALASVISKSGFENAAHFIERVIKAVKPSSDGVTGKILESKTATVCCSLFSLAVLYGLYSIAVDRPEILKGLYCEDTSVATSDTLNTAPTPSVSFDEKTETQVPEEKSNPSK